MDHHINIKQGTTGLGFRATLDNGDDTWDLTTTQVLFIMGPFTIDPEIEDAASRKVIVSFSEEHTAKVKRYKGEFKITHSDNRDEFYPGEGFINVIVTNNAGGGS